jgi:hypothetical protein
MEAAPSGAMSTQARSGVVPSAHPYDMTEIRSWARESDEPRVSHPIMDEQDTERGDVPTGGRSSAARAQSRREREGTGWGSEGVRGSEISSDRFQTSEPRLGSSTEPEGAQDEAEASRSGALGEPRGVRGQLIFGAPGPMSVRAANQWTEIEQENSLWYTSGDRGSRRSRHPRTRAGGQMDENSGLLEKADVHSIKAETVKRPSDVLPQESRVPDVLQPRGIPRLQEESDVSAWFHSGARLPGSGMQRGARPTPEKDRGHAQRTNVSQVHVHVDPLDGDRDTSRGHERLLVAEEGTTVGSKRVGVGISSGRTREGARDRDAEVIRRRQIRQALPDTAPREPLMHRAWQDIQDSARSRGAVWKERRAARQIGHSHASKPEVGRTVAHCTVEQTT